MKEDWPTIYKIKYAMADLLYFQQNWAECGPAFDAVVAENPNGARGRRGRVRLGALLPEHLRPSTHKGDADAQGQRQPPDGADKKEEGEGGGRGGEVQARRTFTEQPEGHDHRLQPLHLLHQAGRERQARRRSSSSR